MNIIGRSALAVGAASTLALGLACSGEERTREAQMHQQTTTVHEESEGSAVQGRRMEFDSNGNVTNVEAETGMGGSGSAGCEEGQAGCGDPATEAPATTGPATGTP